MREISSVKIDFATSNSCVADAPAPMKMIFPTLIFMGVPRVGMSHTIPKKSCGVAAPPSMKPRETWQCSLFLRQFQMKFTPWFAIGFPPFLSCSSNKRSLSPSELLAWYFVLLILNPLLLIVSGNKLIPMTTNTCIDRCFASF